MSIPAAALRPSGHGQGVAVTGATRSPQGGRRGLSGLDASGRRWGRWVSRAEARTLAVTDLAPAILTSYLSHLTSQISLLTVVHPSGP